MPLPRTELEGFLAGVIPDELRHTNRCPGRSPGAPPPPPSPPPPAPQQGLLGEVQAFLRGQVPMLVTQYRRTAYQRQDSAEVRISIDTEVSRWLVNASWSP